MADQTPIPIAIVGMSCRFPGGANDPEKLWEMLANGRSGWTDVPENRWNWKSFYHPNPEANGAHNSRGGCFLDSDISEFDAGFFGIPTPEANAMDPQHRLQLESAYEALENAGIPIETIRGTDTSVHIAVASRDYDRMAYKDTSDLAKYHLTGCGDPTLCGRISYLFDLKGPSVTLDTGCSGSMVCLHQACTGLRTGESSLAIVGGTHLLLGPDLTIAMSLLHMINDDGKCYSFDSRGSGYGRSEGVATVILKRLDDAIRDGDSIRAVIRNTGVNSDGKTNGIMLPSSAAQQSLMESMYRQAGIDPLEVGYIEAHGTGTMAGDAAETNSISRIFCKDGEREKPLFVGSIKANIGHLEATSGLAGLIKSVMILEKGIIPPVPNIKDMKSNLKLSSNIKIPRLTELWPAPGPRLASINSFGFGGTNSHAILQSAPIGYNHHSNGINGFHGTNHKLATNGHSKQSNGVSHNGFDTSNRTNGANGKASIKTNTPLLFAVTAKSEKSLLASLSNLREWLATKDSNDDLVNLAYTLSSRRSVLQWRWTSIAKSKQELLYLLSPDELRGVKSVPRNQLVFLFTGQGAQWFGMGRELISSHSAFRDSLLKSDQILSELGTPWSLLDELQRDERTSNVNRSEISQPATTAIQLALVDLMTSLSIIPHAVIGHSSGEIAAAYAAGALDKETALGVSYHRSFISAWCKEDVQATGAMIAVGLGEEDVLPFISKVQAGEAVVACVNSPSSTTVSGDEAAIVELKKLLDEGGIFNRKLQVDTAYHSHHMKIVASRYLHSLAGLRPSTPTPPESLKKSQHATVKFFSSVTGEEKLSDFGPSYWVENLVSKVRFSDALAQLGRWSTSHSSPQNLFVELGPHSALSGPMRQTLSQLDLPSFKYNYLPSLVRGKDSLDTILSLTGNLFEQGYAVNLTAANSLSGPLQGHVVTDLTPYPWDHSTKYWSESRLSKDYRMRNHPPHELLGLKIVGTSYLEPTWRNILSVDNLPWLQEHIIDNFALFPGSGYLCMAIEAASQMVIDRQTPGKISKFIMRDIVYSKALVVPDSPGSIEIQLSLRPSKGLSDKTAALWEDFRVTSPSQDGTWHEHCRGSIMIEFMTPNGLDDADEVTEEKLSTIAKTAHLAKMRDQCSEKVDSDIFYDGLRNNGIDYGQNFSILKDIKVGDCKAVGTVVIPDISASMPAGFQQPHIIHPATIDALMHIVLPLYSRHCSIGPVMLISIDEVIVSADLINQPGDELYVACNLSPAGSRSGIVDWSVLQKNVHGELIPAVSLGHGEFRGIGDGQSGDSSNSEKSASYNMKWDADVDALTSQFLTPPEINLNIGEMSPAEKRILLDQAASLYINSCLDKTVESSILAEHHIKLFEWMKRHKSTEQSQKLVERPDAGLCLQKVPSAGVEGDVLSRIGSNLSSILTGEIDPLAIMLEDDLLYRMYNEDDSFRQSYLQMTKYVKKLAFKKPHMKILEIGAGTGGATIPLLQALTSEEDSERVLLDSYDFTDISAGFFNKAQSLLQDWEAFVRYKTLDISRDPVEQGFVENDYDLVVAVNVLHATSFIDETLANTRKLLKPGGRLLLIEITRLTPAYNTIYGVLKGWWAGYEDGRKDSPLLSLDKWNDRLIANSFNGVEVSGDDYEGEAQMTTMMVSRAIANDHSNTQQPPLLNIISDPSIFPSTFISHLSSTLETKGLKIATQFWPSFSIDKESVYLVLDDTSHPLLANASSSALEQITQIATQSRSLLWVSFQEVSSNLGKDLINALDYVARKENEGAEFVALNVQESIKNSADVAQAIHQVLSSTFYGPLDQRSDEREYSFNGQLLIPRLVPNFQLDTWINASKTVKITTDFFNQAQRPLKLHIQTPGLLDSLVFVDTEYPPLGPLEIEVEAKAFGVNQTDVSVALGRSKPLTKMIGEFSGVVTAIGSQTRGLSVGDRVCGWGGGAYASRTRIAADLVHTFPATLSFAEAASIPLAFQTAYHCLIEVARLQSDQTILIHSAAGGVGQAAVMIAHHVGANIFATVGDVSKRQLLVERYNIHETQIFSSGHSRAFKKGIHRLTNGRGVDVILNSLSGDQLSDTWDCVANFGTFIEIGKPGKGQLSTEPFDRNVTFASVDLRLIAEHRPEQIRKLQAKVMELVEAGSVSPVYPITATPISDVEAAFRAIQGRKHSGKLVLTASDEDVVKMTAPSISHPALELSENATYIIISDTEGDIDLKIADFMVSRGAQNVIILCHEDFAASKQRVLELQTDETRTTVHILPCETTDRSRMQVTISALRSDFPQIKGVIQTAILPQDGKLGDRMAYNFVSGLQRQLDETRFLNSIFKDLPIDFFVTISSIASILGHEGNGNFSIGNAFFDDDAGMDMANSNTSIHRVSLKLGLIDGIDVHGKSPEHEELLVQQGCIPIPVDVFHKLLEYSMSKQACDDKCNQVAIGFNRASLSSLQHSSVLENPIFSQLSYVSDASQANATKNSVADNIESTIAAAKDLKEVHEIISAAMAKKIAALVALDYEDIRFNMAMSGFGLDSLIAIEFKNWIGRTLLASMQTSEILDAADILALSTLVATRSTLVGSNINGTDMPNGANGVAGKTDSSTMQEVNDTDKGLPKLPLPDLESTLSHYLQSVRGICSPEELQQTKRVIEDFEKPGGVGRRLHERLRERAHNPDVPNWLSETYKRTNFLDRRKPLVPFSNFFFTHPLSKFPHRQSERAALIALTAFEYKQKLEAGEIGPTYLNEQPLCMDLYQWIFNSVRTPYLESDEMEKFPGNDHIVVLRHGRVFKVSLTEDGKTLPFQSIRNIMEAIIDTVDGVEWLGILTTDERDSWAKIREEVKAIDPANKEYLHVIESSAFIICLDDGAPTTSTERAYHFHFGDGSNRWNDKCSQFVVCSNGVSGFVGDHSMLDAGTVNGLNAAIMHAILEYKPETALNGQNGHSNLPTLQEYVFKYTPALEKEIVRTRQQFNTNISGWEHVFLTYSSYGGTFLRARKCPPKSAFQIIVQLAGRKYFGYQIYCWETVSVATFNKGRVELNQILWPEVVEFCNAAYDASTNTKQQRSKEELRKLFYDACRAHSNSVIRASRGHGTVRHMDGLLSMLQESEPMPALFEDPVLGKTRVYDFMSHCHESDMLEKGFVLALPGEEPRHIWVHYEVYDEEVRFSITGPAGRAKEFAKLVEDAAEMVKSWLD